jgi:hypothetical protein
MVLVQQCKSIYTALLGRYGLPDSSKSVYKANVLSVNSATTNLGNFVFRNVVNKFVNGIL